MKLDWLSFTYLPEDLDPATIWDRFQDVFPELKETIASCSVWDKGFLGYNNVLAFNESFLFMVSDKLKQGVHVRVPATSLEYFAECFGCLIGGDQIDLVKLFRLLKDRNCRAARIDFCFDDEKKLITPADLNRYHVMNWNIVTDSRSFKYVQEKGSTFYIGKRHSDRFLRVYDKEAESAGKIKAIRWELEFKNTWARYLFDNIAEGNIPSFRWLLENFMQIKDGDFSRFITKELRYDRKRQYQYDEYVLSQSGLDMRSRAALLSLYQELLESMDINRENVYLSAKSRSNTTVDSSIRWLDNQVVPTLQMLFMLFGSEWIQDRIFSEARLKDKHFKMMDQYTKIEELLNPSLPEFLPVSDEFVFEDC